MYRVPLFIVENPQKQYCARYKKQEFIENLVSDMLKELLGTATTTQKNRCQSFKEEPRPQKWIRRMKLTGFKPSEVSVKVVGDNIIIHARRFTGDDDNSDVRESKRTLSFSEDVDIAKLSSYIDWYNHLVLEAPYVQKQQTKSDHAQKEVDTSDQTEECDNTEDESSESSVMRDLSECKTRKEAKTEFYTGETSTKEVGIENDGGFEVLHPDKMVISGDDTAVNLLETDDSTCDRNILDTSDSQFKLELDLGNYPQDSIKVLHKNNSLIIKAEYTKEKDGINTTEYYCREQSLPERVNTEEIKCVKGPNGKVVVQAPYRRDNEIDDFNTV